MQENDQNEIVELDQTTEEIVETPEAEDDTTDYKAEAAKWKAIAERNKKKASKQLSTERDIDPDLKKDVLALKQESLKRDFGYRHGLSPDETDAVFKINSNPTEDTLKDPFVQGGLEKIRAQKRLDNNIPQPSGGNFTVDGKTWDKLSIEEQRANYPKYIQALSKANRKG